MSDENKPQDEEFQMPEANDEWFDQFVVDLKFNVLFKGFMLMLRH